MKVKDVMTSNPICVQATMFADQAKRIMIEYKLRHLIVLNASIPVGVISVNDFPRYIKPQLAVMDIMTLNNIISINENNNINLAYDLLIRNRIGCLPVLNNSGKLTGIVTISDLT
jgi:CBS domain-containing protein